MKRQIITIVAVAALGFSAMAQDNCGQNCQDKGKKECAEKCEKNGKQCCKGNDKDCKKECTKAPKAMCPFEGLNLSDKQKEQLKQLNADRRADREKKIAEKRDDMKAKKEEGNAKFEEMKAQMKAERKAELEKIKSILTPEQYVKFLENSFLNARHAEPQRMGAHHGGFGMNKGHGNMRKPIRKPGERRLRPVELEPQPVDNAK